LNEDNTAHDHDFMELAVVLDGGARHLCDQGETTIGKGTAVLLRPGTWHAYLDCRALDVLNFCFPLTMTRDEWRHLLHEDVRSMLRSREGLRMARLPDETIDALNVLEPVSRNASGDLGLVIWALDQFAAAVPEKRSLHPAVERAVRLFEDGPGQPWTATDLAQTVGLDKAYLSRLFKAQVGVGPMAYLALLRAERAASLLRSSELNCGEVGLTVGYSDANLFSRRFRARFGVSPSAYRKRARGDFRAS
jgi:AraC family L-rhamnose operon transcriptional activator RhaR